MSASSSPADPWDEPARLADPIFPADAVFDRIAKAFTYHPPKDGQADRYQLLRAQARSFALTIAKSTPESPERDVALSKLEECVMWANAAIARNE